MMDELIEIMLTQVVLNYIPSIENSILSKVRAEMHLERETSNRIIDLEHSVKSIQLQIPNLQKSAQEVRQKTDEIQDLVSRSLGEISTVIEKEIAQKIAPMEERLFRELEILKVEIDKSKQMNKEIEELNHNIKKKRKAIKKQTKRANKIHKATETLIFNSQILFKERTERLRSIVKKKPLACLPSDPSQPDNSISFHKESNSIGEPNAIEAEEIKTVNKETVQIDSGKNRTHNKENNPNGFLSGHTSMPKLIPQRPLSSYGNVMHNSASVSSSKTKSTSSRVLLRYDPVFKCNMCSKSFSYQFALNRHKKRHE